MEWYTTSTRSDEDPLIRRTVVFGRETEKVLREVRWDFVFLAHGLRVISVVLVE
jgi:hypothetical protein